MSEMYLIIIVVLFALAISDLIVGVSNDAVNFLNSAFGSKVAPKWLIFLIAGLGILIGATFSSGMMEVARKGIFNPQMFVFSEIIIIFLAVMVTDVLLLDLFNSFGMPTSTTISIVFELLGSAIAVSLYKISVSAGATGTLSQYINSSSALLIIAGIFISVFIAFTVGSLVQWITRLIFSFRYNKQLTRFGAVYGGFAIAAITHFMIIKGAHGASFITENTTNFISNHIWYVLLGSFVLWTIILQVLNWLFKIDILKIIVLAGTFALAMAFAGNDLVNFIGVPLAGFESFKAWSVSGQPIDVFTMEILANKVKTPTYMLLIAGVIMVITLITSRKAQNVVQTSIDLARQCEGSEKFGSNAFSRFVVKVSIALSDNINKITPTSIRERINKQFTPLPIDESIPETERAAFDKLRATTNLIIAGILIAIGTSYKLPLSTTYVTFMVAMGTSLADKAWGRESAVYRISGVLSVIGGWLLTALIALVASFIMARIMIWGGTIAMLALAFIAMAIIIRTQIRFRKKESEEVTPADTNDTPPINAAKILKKCNKNTVSTLLSASKAYFLCFDGFINENRSQIKIATKELMELEGKTQKLKSNINKQIQKLQQEDIESGHFYVQNVESIREFSNSLHFIVIPIHDHFENNHKPFTGKQIDLFNDFNALLNEYFNFLIHIAKEEKFENINEATEKKKSLFEKIKEMEKEQVSFIKNNEVTTRNAILYFNVLSEIKNMILHSSKTIKAQRDFINETEADPDFKSIHNIIN